MVERVELIPESAADSNLPQKNIKDGFYLKIANIESVEFAKVKTVLSKYSGNIPVIIYCTDTKRKLEAPKELWVNGKESLITEISAILGENNVKLVKN